jgi:hypothetical protein
MKDRESRSKAKISEGRQERLKQALRANLKRRKSAAKPGKSGRKQQTGETPAGDKD